MCPKKIKNPVGRKDFLGLKADFVFFWTSPNFDLSNSWVFWNFNLNLKKEAKSWKKKFSPCQTKKKKLEYLFTSIINFWFDAKTGLCKWLYLNRICSKWPEIVYRGLANWFINVEINNIKFDSRLVVQLHKPIEYTIAKHFTVWIWFVNLCPG